MQSLWGVEAVAEVGDAALHVHVIWMPWLGVKRLRHAWRRDDLPFQSTQIMHLPSASLWAGSLVWQRAIWSLELLRDTARFSMRGRCDLELIVLVLKNMHSGIASRDDLWPVQKIGLLTMKWLTKRKERRRKEKTTHPQDNVYFPSKGSWCGLLFFWHHYQKCLISTDLLDPSLWHCSHQLNHQHQYQSINYGEWGSVVEQKWSQRTFPNMHGCIGTEVFPL